MQEPALWNKFFTKCTLVNFFLMLNVHITFVTTSAYAMEATGVSTGEAGVAVGIFVMGTLISRFFSGQLIKRIGLKNLLVTGVTLGLVLTITYLNLHSIWLLHIIRFIHGLSYGVASVAITTVVMLNMPKARQGEGVGYFMMSTILAIAIGPFLAMFFMQQGGFPIVFGIAMISLFISLAISSTLSSARVDSVGTETSYTSRISISSFIEPKAIPISIVCGLLYFTYSSVMSFLTPYTQELNYVTYGEYFFLIFSFAIVISRPLIGRIFDKKGENVVIYPVFPLLGIGFFFLSQTNQNFTFLVSSVFLGIGFGIVQACGMATAIKGTPSHRIGYASSTFYIIVDLGVGLGPLVVGVLIPYLGYRGMYMSMAVFSFACIFVYFVLHGRKAIGQTLIYNEAP